MWKLTKEYGFDVKGFTLEDSAQSENIRLSEQARADSQVILTNE